MEQCRFNNKVECRCINEEMKTLQYCQCCILMHMANQLNVIIKQNNCLLEREEKR
jgi:hypothetical protein